MGLEASQRFTTAMSRRIQADALGKRGALPSFIERGLSFRGNEMKRLGLIFLFGLTLICAGCKQADPMPGKWKLYVAGSGESQKLIGGSAEFKSDMTCEMHTVFDKDQWTFKGTYSVKGTVLTIDGEMTEVNPGGFDSKAQIEIKPINRKEKLVATGSLSDDFKTFRIDGKDFQKE